MGKTVILKSCDTSFEALLIQERLKSEGIDSVLHNENFSNIYGGIVGNFTSVDVLVWEDELESARKIIAQDE